MGDSAIYLSQNNYTWFRKVCIILQEKPISVAWVHFYKYIILNSKSSISFIKNVNGTRTNGPHIWVISSMIGNKGYHW